MLNNKKRSGKTYFSNFYLDVLTLISSYLSVCGQITVIEHPKSTLPVHCTFPSHPLSIVTSQTAMIHFRYNFQGPEN